MGDECVDDASCSIQSCRAKPRDEQAALTRSRPRTEKHASARGCRASVHEALAWLGYTRLQTAYFRICFWKPAAALSAAACARAAASAA